PTGAVERWPSSTEASFHVNGQLRSQKLALVPSNSLPHGYRRPSVLRAAFSHSASVGRRLPAQVQYALASCQLTCTTGCASSPAMPLPCPRGARQVASGTWAQVFAPVRILPPPSRSACVR